VPGSLPGQILTREAALAASPRVQIETPSVAGLMTLAVAARLIMQGHPFYMAMAAMAIGLTIERDGAELFADRYRLERRLGVGGMATVQLAFDTRLERNVAVKLLAEDFVKVGPVISLVIVLVAFGELTPTEIAGVLGRAVGTVRSQLFRARMALRQLLADAPGPEGRDA
jgi:hypothetical protein